MEKVVLKWSKKNKDWVCDYPNNNGRTIGGDLFMMIRKYNDYVSKDDNGNPTNHPQLRQHLEALGYDADTFTISVKKKRPTI